MSAIASLWISFTICLISAGIGMCLGLKHKGIEREKMRSVGIWIFLGFASFLLVLMANAVELDFHYADEILIGIVYSYFMSDAAIFDTER